MKARAPNASRRGTTLVELVLFMGILLVSLSIFSGTIAATSRQRTINRENAIAAEGARFILEQMRSEPLGQLWSRYNANPADDLGGPGTAPGNRFPVAGLRPRADSPDGMIGEIRFPVVADAAALPAIQLREDVVDRSLGMPRDLNGDLVIDDLDHGGDFMRLPVEVELQWTGEAGDRTLSITTMFCEFDFGT